MKINVKRLAAAMVFASPDTTQASINRVGITDDGLYFATDSFRLCMIGDGAPVHVVYRAQHMNRDKAMFLRCDVVKQIVADAKKHKASEVDVTVKGDAGYEQQVNVKVLDAYGKTVVSMQLSQGADQYGYPNVAHLVSTNQPQPLTERIGFGAGFLADFEKALKALVGTSKRVDLPPIVFEGGADTVLKPVYWTATVPDNPAAMVVLQMPVRLTESSLWGELTQAAKAELRASA